MKLRFDIRKIRKSLEKILFLMAENIFSSCLILILLALILGSIIFLKALYSLRSEKYESFESLKLEKERYNDILERWEQENKKFEQSEDKRYKNVFMTSSFYNLQGEASLSEEK